METNRSLFHIESIHATDFIVLNWHGQPINEFGLFAEAYHCAAKRLASDYGNTRSIRDFEATPILFLYRHALELYLKAFIISGSFLLPRELPKIKTYLKSHRISDLIQYFEAIILKAGWSWDLGIDGLNTKKEFVNLIEEFEKIDPNSFAFRYPTTKTSYEALPHHFSFNLSSVTQRLDPLLELLDGSLLGLEELKKT